MATSASRTIPPPTSTGKDIEEAVAEHEAEQLGCGAAPEVYAYPDGLPVLPAKPPANIPKAVHHLRKAANALPNDVMQAYLERIMQDFMVIEAHSALKSEACRLLGICAAALDHDVHAGGAAKDVRAAIEALS